MISEAVNTFLDAISSRFFGAIDFITDPFWGFLFVGIVIIAAVVALTYFFGSYFPALRPIGGVILLLITFGLYSYRKGEKDGEKRKPVSKPKPKPQQDSGGMFGGWR